MRACMRGATAHPSLEAAISEAVTLTACQDGGPPPLTRTSVFWIQYIGFKGLTHTTGTTGEVDWAS